jgi:pimeloyl-ACP methyl ester carboxylesterase
VAARLLLTSITDLPLDLLERVTMPALVVCGDEDEDNGSASDLAVRLPNAAYAEIPGTHMNSVTRPELGRAIAEWLGPSDGR